MLLLGEVLHPEVVSVEVLVEVLGEVSGEVLGEVLVEVLGDLEGLETVTMAELVGLVDWVDSETVIMAELVGLVDLTIVMVELVGLVDSEVVMADSVAVVLVVNNSDKRWMAWLRNLIFGLPAKAMTPGQGCCTPGVLNARAFDFWWGPDHFAIVEGLESAKHKSMDNGGPDLYSNCELCQTCLLNTHVRSLLLRDEVVDHCRTTAGESAMGECDDCVTGYTSSLIMYNHGHSPCTSCEVGRVPKRLCFCGFAMHFVVCLRKRIPLRNRQRCR